MKQFLFLLFALTIAVPTAAISSDGVKQIINVDVLASVMIVNVVGATNIDVLTANAGVQADNIDMLAVNTHEVEPAWTNYSGVQYVPVVGLSEMEKANNALATVFDRSKPHAQPVLVQVINYPRHK